MAYDYDVDILAALWTGAEDGEEPYASFIAANPDITNEVAENRILSTIELLRSHMELLQSREEANLLHFAISRLIRHSAGGSNPWSEEAAVTTAVGNVSNPQFPAGANVEIIIDGVTTSATSASGGDCATVVAELNAALDASIPGVAEETDTDLSGKDAAGLSGKYFTLNSAGDATNYYVWYNASAGIPEVTEITPIGDTLGSLSGKYFTINAGADSTNYYVWMSTAGSAEAVTTVWAGITGGTLPTGAVPAAWFDMSDTLGATYRFWFSDGSTTPPAVTTEILVPIAFTGADTDIVIAGAVFTAVTTGASADFAPLVLSAGTTVGGSLASVGNVTDPVDGAVSTGATIGTVTQGVNPSVDPAPGGLTGIPVTYTVGDGALTLASLISGAIGGNADFSAFDAGGVVTATAAATGVTTDSADVDTGFTVSTTQQGAGPSVDPAPGGLTALPISVSAGESDSEIAANTRTGIGTNADFSTEGVGTAVEIANAAVGDTTDAADVDTGLTLTVTTQGTDAVGDAVAVQAFCQFPGPRIAFRSQEDFLTFEISNGTGGIVGPGGVIPGVRLSTPARVADEGRNAAVANYVGKRGGTLP